MDDMNVDNEYGVQALRRLISSLLRTGSESEDKDALLSRVEVSEGEFRQLLNYLNGVDISASIHEDRRNEYIHFRRTSVLLCSQGMNKKENNNTDESSESPVAVIGSVDEIGAKKAAVIRFWLLKCGYPVAVSAPHQMTQLEVHEEGTTLPRWVNKKQLDVRIFLNRLLGLEVEKQNTLFKVFQSLFREEVLQAKRDSTYDGSIIKLSGNVTRFPGTQRELISDRFGFSLYHDQLHVDSTTSYDEALNLLARAE